VQGVTFVVKRGEAALQCIVCHYKLVSLFFQAYYTFVSTNAIRGDAIQYRLEDGRQHLTLATLRTPQSRADQLDDRGVRVRVPVGSRILISPYLLWDPPNLLLNGYWGLFPRGGKAAVQECEADHSPPSSAEVKKT
jgi:hypothetical protein